MRFSLCCTQAAVLLSLLSGGATAQAGVHLPVPYMAQPDNQTCFPTSLMMAMNYLGRIDDFSSDTIQHLHKYCQYNRFNAPEIAPMYGLHALPSWHNLGWNKDTIKHELNMGRPVVLGTFQGGQHGHFVLAVGYTDDDQVIIHDPGRYNLGSALGGPDRVTTWENLLWRGGIIVRPTPFPQAPPLSGVAINADGDPLETTYNLYMTEGDDAQVTFTLLNNGRIAWPEKLYLAPLDPDSSPTTSMQSPIATSAWIAPDRVTDSLSSLEPATSRVVTFNVKAPSVTDNKNQTFLQYFNLVDDQGNWFGNHYQTGPGHRNIGVRLIVLPKDRPQWNLPLHETFAAATSPDLPWGVKFGELKLADDFTTAPPKGGNVVHLRTQDHVYDSAWVGDNDWTDYRVEAWVYADIRPEIKDRMWERLGIFARDNGQHMANNKNEREIGFTLGMFVDTDDGAVRAGHIQNGAVDDYREVRHRLPKSGWYHFAITCKGTTITYELDGEVFHTEKNVRKYRNGDTGVFYTAAHDPQQPVNNLHQGIYFSDFKVSTPE